MVAIFPDCSDCNALGIVVSRFSGNLILAMKFALLVASLLCSAAAISAGSRGPLACATDYCPDYCGEVRLGSA